MEIAELVRSARLSAGLSQHALARRAETSQSAVARYESGASTPSLTTLQRLLAAAGQELVVEARPLESRFAGPVGRRLEGREARLLSILRRHGASRPRVFGSVARGDDREGSDLDLLVEVRDPDYVGLEELRAELEAELGVGVDLAVEGLLRDEVRERTRRDAVPL
jgi:predicted nucleotidyltransferase/DNA-binding XRE family transcriptional regulator